MLGLWAAAGLLDGKLYAQRGPLLAVPDCIVSATSVQTAVPPWARALDPADRTPFAYNFGPLFLPDEEIIAIDEILVSAVGRELGVYVIDSGAYVPTIAGDKADHVQFWPAVEQRFWEATDYDRGVPFTVRFTIQTNLTPKRQLQRRGGMTGAQQ